MGTVKSRSCERNRENGRRKAVTRFSYNALEKTVQESILKLIK